MPYSRLYRICALVLLACAAVGSRAAELASETRPVSGFDQVELRTPGTLSIEQGARDALVIEAEASVLPKLTSSVRNGVLYLDSVKGGFRTREPVRFRVTVQRLSRVATDSGDVAIGPVSTSTLTVQIEGSGSVRVARLTADALRIDMDGAGNASVESGAVKAQRITMSGAGDYEAPNLDSRSAEVSIDGAGNALVNVRDKLSAAVSGSGTVRYAGRPAVVRSVTGAGSVEPAE